jgi:glutamyl-tRNA synthetase
MPFINKEGYEAAPGPILEKAIETLQARSKTLVEMAKGLRFYFVDEVVYEEKGAKKFLKAGALEPMDLLIEKLDALPEFTHEALEQAFLAVMEALELKLGKIAQPVRLALTGSTVSPGIFEIIEVLGKAKTLERLRAAVAWIKENRVDT